MTDEPYTREFKGSSRRELVAGLEAIFERLAHGSDATGKFEPIWVSLEAPPGWGKTRVVLEFYSRLAKSQEDPAYWPSAIMSDEELNDPELRRTKIFPVDPHRDKDSLPEFLWFGIACALRQNLPAQTWREDIQQLGCHMLYLEAAYRAIADARETWGPRLRAARKAIIQQGRAEAFGAAIAHMGWLFPGIALIPKAAVAATKGIKGHIETREAIATASSLNTSGTSDELDEIVNFLTKISNKGFRIVILIEDIHHAHEMVWEFVDKIMDRAGSVLIISTTWPEEVEKIRKASRTFERHTSRVIRVTETELAPEPFRNGAGLMELEEEARLDLLKESYPKIDPNTSALLLKRYLSPLALKLFCKIDKFHRRFPNGDLRLDVKEINRLPDELKGLYSMLWDEIPVATRTALAVAWFIAPENISSSEAAGDLRWSHSMLHKVISSLSLAATEKDTMIRILKDSHQPHAWVRVVDDYLRTFLEPQHNDIVGQRAGDFLYDKLIGDARDEILAALVAHLTEMDEVGSAQVNRARTVLALYSEKYLSDQQIVAEAIDLLLGELAGNRREVEEQRRLAELFDDLDPSQAVSSVGFSIRRKIAKRLDQEDRPHRAIEMYEALVEDMRQSKLHGYDHIDTLRVRYDLAACHGDLVRTEEATRMLEEIVQKMEQIVGPTDIGTLEAQLSLAFVAGDEMRCRRTLKVLREVLKEDEADYLRRAVVLVRLLDSTWDLENAIAECRDLIAQMTDVFGPAHYETLTMRAELSHLLERGDRFKEALPETRSLLEDMHEALGNEHLAALKVRDQLAYELSLTDETEEAQKVANRLVADSDRILGRSHPVTRHAEIGRICVLLNANRHANAVEASEDLLSDLRNSPAEYDRMGSYVRGWYSEALQAVGRIGDAIDVAREELEHSVRVLGEEHLGVFAQRQNIVDLLQEAALREPTLMDDALTESNELVSDALRTLGSDSDTYLHAVKRLRELLNAASKTIAGD